ncbi:MAG: Tat pathway signal protein [Oscillospiraceae bacterium]|nr:Tat pathway signal protein [Oscillospiraceae bacterium]
MPIVIGMFFLVPLLLGLVLEYLCCRLPRRRIWRALPPVLGILLTVLVGVGRWSLWESETVSPMTQLLIFPGVPGAALLLGCWLGWRLWRRIWQPRVLDGP